MDSAPTILDRVVARLRSWEGLLLVILVAVIALNAVAAPGYAGSQNQVNLWWISIERAIVVLAMAFVIINGEIDLSVASVMGLASVIVAVVWEAGLPIELGIAWPCWSAWASASSTASGWPSWACPHWSSRWPA